MSNENRPAIQDTRERILATGECLILGKGFSAMGLSELLSAAAVPKGSFYHYFASKEAFGVALLERYFRDYQQKTAELFGDSELSAKQKLMLYFDQWLSLADVPGCNKLCLGVKLAAEVADLSDAMRQALSEGMALHCDQIAGVIRDAIQEGSVAANAEPSELASFLYSSWIGASILAKVRKDGHALHAAHRQTMQCLFGNAAV
ncbi:TetR/AcrR family transcriptional regulator [Undibacterium luofuense]|jgi:TetR/AcrR family transcriptional repressor of nem operon|uniref:TetR/AcrR family transcriptional regulator n=1 Tax=Undibacterium luofuense TaxID=2828733 RepID=UPI0030EE9A26